MATVYVNTDVAAAGGDGSQGNPYKTLAEALTPYRVAGVTTTPVTIRCSGTAADPGVSGLGSAYSLDHSVWEFVTSPTNYIEIIGDNTTGKWDATKYHIQVTDRHGIYNQYAAHVRIYNLQMMVKMTTPTAMNCYRLSTANNNITNGLGYLIFKNCIARFDPTSTDGEVFGFSDSCIGGGTDDAASKDARGDLRRINCLVIGIGTAQCSAYATDDGPWARAHLRSYNCTAAKTKFGYNGNAVSVNSLATGCLIGFTSDFTGTDYCAEDDGNGVGGGGTHNVFASGATAFAFVDAPNGDYHLASGDGGAKDKGTDLSGLGIFTDDIDGGTRPFGPAWDIGADELGADTPASGGGAGTTGYRTRYRNGNRTR